MQIIYTRISSKNNDKIYTFRSSSVIEAAYQQIFNEKRYNLGNMYVHFGALIGWIPEILGFSTKINFTQILKVE